MTAPTTTTMRWQLLPTVVVRSAGFPWDMVDRLRYAETHAAQRDLHEDEAAAVALMRDTPLRGRPPRRIQARIRALRPLPEDTPVPAEWLTRWNALAERIGRTRDRIELAAHRDAERVDAAIRELVTDPRFRDAVACSSPPALRDLRPDAIGARARRQVAAYTQRFSAKCETMSFFGPINYATVDTAANGRTDLDWGGHRELAARVAHPAARVVDTFQAAVLADPASPPSWSRAPRPGPARPAATVPRSPRRWSRPPTAGERSPRSPSTSGTTRTPCWPRSARCTPAAC